MPIPREILEVKRPKNTVVCAYGKDKNRYSVRQRTGCKYDHGRRIPVTGKTIGHIVDGKYVPNEERDEKQRVSHSPIDLKDWANIMLCDSLFRDILRDLKRWYNEKDALSVYCIAILRVCHPGIKNCELKEAYETGFLSEIYPGVALSKNTVSSLLNHLGKSCSVIASFMRERAGIVNEDHHLLIDGTLKTNDSKVNSLSDFSRKAKTKGRRDISVLFAFDLEAMEPICSKCFPGNMLDFTSYEAFLSENGITKGLVVGDKGFPSSAVEPYMESHPGLHYLNPIKRNSRLIETHHLLEHTGILPGYDGITYRKEKCRDKDKWLYSFRDARKAAKEEQDWLSRAKKNGSYSIDEFRKKQATFGVIVLESDLDMPPEVVYKAYESRWEIELVMRFYKSACEFDETRVHDDYSVIASEFCDFLSTLLTFRIIKRFDQIKLLDRMSYKKIMSILRRAKKVKWGSNEWCMVRTSPSHMDILQKLDLLPTPEPIPKKRGRPKKSVV